ncbi:hypothetical protein [Pseudomonas mediterranea]|uniref:hypothetical protein n=1 Tax=Pseudomonas mediterranea TaxID=183795 RepID=UPI0006D8BAE2|nr:hypothetical protein [Pseudomonas mediterranea]
MSDNTVATPMEAMPAKVSAPVTGAFGRVVGTRVARRMIQSLIDQRVPVSVEYVCADVMLSVPFTFATVLDKAREAAERDLQAGMFAPAQVVAP